MDTRPNTSLEPEAVAVDWRAAEAAAKAELAAAHIDRNRMLLEEHADGRREVLHYDEAEDRFAIEIVRDVEPTIEWVKGRYDETMANRHRSEFWHVGSYPEEIFLLYGKANGISDPNWHMKREYDELFQRAINDSGYGRFRTMGGRF